MAKKFSGAEVEEVIVEAMRTAFSENREFTVNDILESINQFVPLAHTNQEKSIIYKNGRPRVKHV